MLWSDLLNKSYRFLASIKSFELAEFIMYLFRQHTINPRIFGLIRRFSWTVWIYYTAYN